MTGPLLLGCVLALLSCSRDSAGPAADEVRVSVLSGDAQFGLAGADLADTLQVMVVDATSGRPAEDISVTWLVRSGGGTVSPTVSRTDARGIATARLRLGLQLGTNTAEATAATQVGAGAVFTAEAILRPEIQAITPAAAAAGQIVVITGSNYHPQAQYNAVRFDGIRGQVLSATTSRIEAVVPNCVPTRTVAVDVLVGAVASASRPLAATGVPGSTLSLAPGASRVLTGAAEFACVRLPGGISGARYALIAQSAATTFGAATPFELISYTGAAPAAVVAQPAAAGLPAAEAFELGLRQRERAWVSAAAELRAARRALAAQVAEPQVGDRRTFRVLTQDNHKSVTVTAEVRAVSQHTVLYQDVSAPAGGFTAADFTAFGALFDDPIYDTDVEVFGQPSDIDGNGRVIVLFTPQVNALTDRGESSFIAGYFYGCDLVDKTRCVDSNLGEIFYSLVPDPQAKFGDTRLTATVFRAVLPVLAHEFQHMISFAQRQQSLDAIWLSEGLAHTAEELVGDVFAARGDATNAREFRRTNYARASRFLSALPGVSLIAEDSPGTLEMRGGSYLLLRYLRAHYGGAALLGKLTRSNLTGTRNVSAQTGESWARLLADFGLALYGETVTAPGVAPLDPLQTFGTLPVRAAIVGETGSYPLLVRSLGFGDAAVAGTLPPAGNSIFLLAAPAGSAYAPLNLVFSGKYGGPFTSASAAQLIIYRAR